MTATADTRQSPAFRHDPVKSVLPGPTAQVLWDREPIVCGYRRLSHRTSTGVDIAVPVSSTPAVVGAAGVVVGSYDGRIRLYAHDFADVRWEHRLAAPVYASLMVDRMRSTVLAAAVDGTVICVGLDGDVVWRTRVDASIYATPTVLPDADLLVIAGFGSRCAGLDLVTGEEAFAVSLPRPWHANVGGSAAVRDPYASPLALPGGDFVVGCAEHALRLTATGKQVWLRDIGHSVRASPAFAAVTKEVVVCTVDGQCRFLDVEDGRETGTVVLDGKVIGSPAVSGGVLAVSTQCGSALGVDLARHDIAWATGRGATRDHTSFTVLPNGDFAFTSENGDVVARSRADGRFLWETSQLLGLTNHDPALDTTPVAAPDGSMYCGSYSGVLYRFRFRPAPAGRP
ncbi:PQQ-binding-like beta-propeller repeat protein [Amycolatopsis sp. cmx-4-68]|uniref:outer membrane protein assembly factor BamB family protein n=1 Tax=Amycolatopsis sp. cmx-4-68 TaxID=2790938 RepID=UPI00397C6896